MKRVFLFAGLLLLVFITACQSAEADEVLEYHNDYVENVANKMDDIDVANEKIWMADTDEEAMDAIDNDLEPLLNNMKDYMDKQDPEKDATKEYHELRLNAFNAFYDSLQMDIETFRGLMDESISEEEADERYEQSDAKFAEAQELSEKAEDKIDELADKYKFEEEEAEEN